ncbi:MAG: PD-(D/E)XK nuclease family protein, partial [Planctomycetota bacterium]|nr:PD-(D/E)XK nuclease family protein [Planctomycetota bacterium]
PARRIFFTADTLANEAREVFRRLAALGLRLDQAEAVCLDPAAYAPALIAAGREIFGGRPEDLPLTMSGGLPADVSRPARLLLAWLEWLADGLPPASLADLAASGLIGDGWLAAAPGILPHQLAGFLLELPIQGQPAEYRAFLRPAAGSGGSRSAREKALSWLGAWVDEVLPMADGRERLALDDAPRVLRAARNLLARPDPAAGKLDAYAAGALLDAIDAWLPLADWPGLDAPAWLEGLASGLRVMGLGPLPGRLHVSGLADGGHSGRACTFILGMDDSRFPGDSRENAALLDRERLLLSPALRLSGHWRRRREDALRGLLDRAGGRLFLSCARIDVRTGRDLFPASLFSQLRGQSAGDETADDAGRGLIRPAGPEDCLAGRDDWLHTLLAARQNSLTRTDLAPWFPALAQGEAALAERAASRFGAYDGLVPEAGADLFAGRKPLSPSDLERLAACPLDFFLRNLLEVRPPRRFKPEPGRWLAANERGTLLHDVFQRFAEETSDAGADDGSWGPLMERLLAQALEQARRRHPPADDLVRRREERELAGAADIFLANERELRQSGRPAWLELSLGGPDAAPPWDRIPELVLEPAPGLRLPFMGRIDRVDRLAAGGLSVIDYKTGAAGKFSLDDPLRQGRHLQPLLYILMLERALAMLGRPEEVAEFSYFFPMPRQEGRSIRYRRQALADAGKPVLASLLALIRDGLFPFSNEAADVEYSDYLPVYGDVGELAGQAAGKMRNDPTLAVWAALRGVKP